MLKPIDAIKCHQQHIENKTVSVQVIGILDVWTCLLASQTSVVRKVLPIAKLFLWSKSSRWKKSKRREQHYHIQAKLLFVLKASLHVLLRYTLTLLHRTNRSSGNRMLLNAGHVYTHSNVPTLDHILNTTRFFSFSFCESHSGYSIEIHIQPPLPRLCPSAIWK